MQCNISVSSTENAFKRITCGKFYYGNISHCYLWYKWNDLQNNQGPQHFTKIIFYGGKNFVKHIRKGSGINKWPGVAETLISGQILL